MKAEGKENKNSLLAICRSSAAAGGVRSNCYEFFDSFCIDKKNEEKLLSPAANDNPELFQHYFNANHLGSGSLITDNVGATYQTLAYAPHGELLVNEINGNYDEPYKFTGYERDHESGLDYAHARYREPDKTIFYSTDPLWFNYPYITSYAYCSNNPIRNIDPDGNKIKGVTKKDAQNFRDDIYKVLADDKFANVRALINVKGKNFNKIDAGALSSAMEGLTLTDDESTYITMVTNTINSKEVHNVEYLNYSDDVSYSGSRAMTKNLNATVSISISSDYIWKTRQLATQTEEGLTIPIKNGTHSFIINGIPNIEATPRAVISGHEVFGHGIPLVRGLSESENNANAIRTDNLIRRLLKVFQTDGSRHGGYKEGQITNPNQLPITQ